MENFSSFVNPTLKLYRFVNQSQIMCVPRQSLHMISEVNDLTDNSNTTVDTDNYQSVHKAHVWRRHAITKQQIQVAYKFTVVVYNLYSGTVFAQNPFRPSQVVLLLQCFCKGFLPHNSHVTFHTACSSRLRTNDAA